MRMKKIFTGVLLFGGAILAAIGQPVTILHNFTNTPDGATPLAIAGSGGVLYGSTSYGGLNAYGALFKFDTNTATYSVFYSFHDPATNGQSPNNIIVSNGVVYGTTEFGGTNTGSYGCIYSVNVDGSGFNQLYSFSNAPDGETPVAGLLLSGNTLFGTTHVAGTGVGAAAGGTIFKINANGTGYSILHSFTNTPDGAQPQCDLVLAGSTLYGTTTGGGTNGTGTIFSIDTNGNNYGVLYSFMNQPDAVRPYGGLALSGATLYGTASGGGSNNTGAIFAINTNGTGYRVIYNFSGYSGNVDGAFPKATLKAAGSYLYGTTVSGGSGNGGTVFIINTNGSGFTVIASLTNAITGSDPLGGITRYGNALWGANGLGSPQAYGTFFSVPMPAVVAQPRSLTVSNTSAVSFSVTAADDQPLKYQWYFNTNTPLAMQTNSSLNFSSVASSNYGVYTVVVSDNSGAVTSSPALLVVTAPPTITQEPQDFNVTNGATATFTNMATGPGTLVYQWYFNTNTPVNGGTGPILTISPATTNQAGYYTVVVTNLYGATTSSAARLFVTVPSPPMITQNPQNFTVTNGATATFTNAANGTGTLYYQWYFNTNTPVNGATGPILTLSPATTNQAGYYTVVVTNLYGAATSSAAKLIVIVPVVAPMITQQPQNYTVTNGYNATFTNAASGTAPFSYQWYFNTNTPVPGGTNAILVVSFAATNNAGYYRVIVTNSAGSATSAPARLTVISTAPIIFIQPQDLTVTNNGTANFTVTAAGAPPLTYQWYTNRVYVLYSLSGKTNSTLTISPANTNWAKDFLVYISNSLGKITSNPALLTVLTKPIITQQPQSVVVTNGNPATFTSAADGPAPLAYQWFFHTNSSLTGAITSSLTFTNVYTTLAGYYSVRVTNSYGAVTSTYALLSVSNGLNFLSYNFDPASGSASLALANAVSSTNRLWATTNLSLQSAWFVIASNVMAANGLWFYTDTNSARSNALRCYRFSTP